MRQGGFIAACAAATLILFSPAHAQVVINQQALQQLEGKPAQPKPAPKPKPVHKAPHPAHKMAHYPVWRGPLPLPPPPAPLPAAAEAPAPKPAPPIPAPKPKPKPKPMPKARTIEIGFAGTGAGLSSDATEQLKAFVATPPQAGTRFVVRAAAPGPANDPSVARRRSLERGLAVRDILRQSGIAPERIIVQALGNPPGVPTERVTVTEIP